ANVGGNSWTQPGIVRLGEPDEPDNINPMFGHTSATDEVDGLVFAFLLRYDADGNYIPDLATQVPTTKNGGISADGKTIVVHLRAGAKWSDGAPLTAHDWIFTYHAVLNPANNTKMRYGWDDIAGAVATNDTTIVIHLKHADAAFLGTLAMGGSAYPPLPEHLLAKLPNLNTASFNDAPISSGPYILQQWNHGSSLVFVPNPYYFRGEPKLKRIIWRVIPDPNTQFSQLQTHEIDVYPGVSENAIPRLHDISGIRVVRKLVANWRHLGFNMSKPLLSDIRVRRAITEAVDWKRLNDTVYHGYDRLAVSDIYPNSWAAPTLPPYRYDPRDAEALLRDAGWRGGTSGYRTRDGKELRLTLSTGTGNMENAQAEVVIQSMLKAVGIDVRIRNYPVSLLFAQNGPIYSGAYDMEWSIETNGPDPDNSGSWNGAFIPPNGADTSWLNDPIVNRLSTEALRTNDRAVRKALYQREEERLRALYPQVAVYWENKYTALNSDLRHYEPAAFITDTWNAWQWTI
ncbi:MAG: ABC transporter substrate-binding protein, partial [Vulcanimicrobiaceae bacterium]